MSDLEIVSKLVHPLEEVRRRALTNISSKLELRLVDLDHLVDTTPLVQHLLLWIQQSDPNKPVLQISLVLKLLHTIIEKSSYGRQMVSDKNGERILQMFRARSELTLSRPDLEVLSLILGELMSPERSNSEISIQSDTLSSSRTTTCFTPADLVANRSLPQYLLNPTSSERMGRICSPVTRSYFNKKVTFNDQTSVTDETQDELADPFSSSVFGVDSILQWQPLARSDREILNRIGSGLTSQRPEIIREACEEFLSGILEHFPSEVFIQRPDLTFTLLDILIIQTNEALKALAAQALKKMIDHIRDKILLLHDVNFVATKDTFITTVPLQDKVDRSSIEEDEESFNDYINRTQLKERELLLHEFCLLCLNNAAATYRAVTEWKSLNACIQLFDSALLLLQFVFGSATNKNWILMNRGRAKTAKEVLDEIARELGESLTPHQIGEKSCDFLEMRFHRLAHLSVIKSSVDFMHQIQERISPVKEMFPYCSKLKKMLALSLADETLYLSHRMLHKRMCSLYDDTDENVSRFNQIKNIFKSLAQAVRVFKEDQRPSSKKQLLKCCQEALETFVLHQNSKIVPLVFSLCKSVSREEPELARDCVFKLISFSDFQIKIFSYCELHLSVQGAFGISHALDVDSKKISELSFLLDGGAEIFKEILEYGMILETKHIRQAAEEVVLYLLKGERTMGSKLWQKFLETVLRPNLPLLECFALTSSSKLDSQESETRSFLGNFVSSMLTPDSDRQVISGIRPIDIVKGNLRLMFNKHSDVRENAQAKIKCLLSQETDSSLKFPRFSNIVKTELTDYFIGHKVQMISRNIDDSGNEELATTVQDLFYILDADESVDSSLKRAALQKLNLILSGVSALQKVFIDLGGIQILDQYLERCLSETNQNYPVELLPQVVQLYKVIAVQQQQIRDQLAKPESISFLFSLIRSAFCFPNDQYLRRDVTILFVIILFHGHIQLEPTSPERPHQLSIPKILATNLIIPIECSIIENVADTKNDVLSDSKTFHGYLGLIKTFWNFSWFEGARNVFQHEDTISPKLFSERLQWTKSELKLAKVSFLDFSLENLPNQIKAIKDHISFFDLMGFVSAHLLIVDTKDLSPDDHRYFPLKDTLGKFLTQKPMSYRDEKLLFCSIEFITQLLKKVTDQTIWIDYIVEMASLPNGVILHFLMRSNTGSKHAFMVKKGHERIGLFLEALCSVVSADDLSRVLQGIMEAISAHQPAKNLWILRVLGLLTLNYSDPQLLNFICSQERDDKEMKPELFQNSCNHLWAAINVHNMLSSNTSDEALAKVEVILPLLKCCLKHQNPLIRLASLQIISQMAALHSGAAILVPASNVVSELWTILMEIACDVCESGHVRVEALEAMKQLLRQSTTTHWFGPVEEERVSKVVIRGESAILLFFNSSRFEEFVVRQFRLFAHFHNPNIDDREDDSIRPSQSSASEDPTTSWPRSECPTPVVVSGLLSFIEQVLLVDQSASLRMNESIQSLPVLFSSGLQPILGLAFDASDQHSHQIMSELAQSPNDYALMFQSLSNLLCSCLVHLNDMAFNALKDNNATCQSMLVSSTHHLWEQDRNQVSTVSLFRQHSELLAREPDGSLNKYLAKFFPALLDMLTESLDDAKIAFDQNALKFLSFAASMFRYIAKIVDDSANRCEMSDIILSALVTNAEKCSRLCQTLLQIQFFHRDDSLVIQSVNVALQHIFLVSDESKEFALNYQANGGQSLLILIVDELTKLLSQLSVFVNSTPNDDHIVLDFWSNADNFFNLANNFCKGNAKIKVGLVQAEIIKIVIHFVTVILDTGNQNGSAGLKNLLLVILCNILSFVATLTSQCPEAKICLPQNVTPQFTESRFQSTSKPQSLLQILLKLCSESDSSNDSRRLFSSVDGEQTYKYVIVPKVFRIINAAITVVECRSHVIRSKFFGDLASNLTNFTSQGKFSGIFQRNMLILTLDLFVTLTTYSDGQSWIMNQTGLVEKFIELSSLLDSREENNNKQLPTAALAILRNVSFHPNGRVKLLNDKSFLFLIKQLIGQKQLEEIALSIVWALAHNNHRAKMVFLDAGITKTIREECHRRELKSKKSKTKKDEDDLIEIVKKILVEKKKKSQ